MMALNPRVSVCVVTYNQREYVGRCIESVLEQAADVPLEIIIGDDCSDDGTSDIVAAFAAKHPDCVVHLRQEKRSGVFENVRRVISRASGEFIASVDGDDYWFPGKLKAQLDFLDRNDGCAAVYTNAVTISASGEPIGIFNNVGSARFDLAAILRRGNFLNSSSVLARAALAKGLLDVEGGFIDYFAHLRYARAGYLAQLAQPYVAYRVNSTGSMLASSNDRVRMLYWQAITDVPRSQVSDHEFALGIVDFLRRVCFRAVRSMRWDLLRQWIPTVYSASPYGEFRTSLLLLGALVRAAWQESLAWLELKSTKNPVRVLYRR